MLSRRDAAKDITDIRLLRENKGVTYRKLGEVTKTNPQKLMRMFHGYQNMSKEMHEKILQYLKGVTCYRM
jgi:hypothetical protein